MIFFTIFSYEHFIFINYITSFLKAKQSDTYKCFTISPLKASEFTTYELWLKINEIYAYKRFYLIIMTKKFNPYSILITIIVIFLNLPLKAYSIIKFLIQQNANLHDSLLSFYFFNYDPLKNKKIEIIFKNTYLNALTKNDIILKIMKSNPEKSIEDITIVYQRLVKCNHNFMNDRNLPKTMIPFKLGLLKTEEGVKISVPHWTSTSY